MEKKVIIEPLYGFSVSVFIGGTYEELRRESLIPLEEYSDRTRGMFAKVDENLYYLWIEDLDNIPFLAHEVLHLAICEFRLKGMELNEGSEEALAYLYEWWLNEILNIKQNVYGNEEQRDMYGNKVVKKTPSEVSGIY